MKILIAPAIFLLMICIEALDYDTMSSIENELRELEMFCAGNSCATGGISDSLTGPRSNGCQCRVQCAQLGTCCIDSNFIYITLANARPSCRSVIDGSSYFMVDHCSSDSAWESLCSSEWNGDDDIMKIVPVTSLHSLITYKNYFCFRCHETTDDYLYWNIHLTSFDEFDQNIVRNKSVSLHYDQKNQIWLAPGNDGALVSVNLTIQTTEDLTPFLTTCDSEMIWHCSKTWTNETVRTKCEAYMGKVNIERDQNVFKYKNIHCAECNFEDVGNLKCVIPDRVIVPDHDLFPGKEPFSFTDFLDINPSDGEKVGKIQMCKTGDLWDPFAEKCRKLSCAFPGYVVRNGKCVAPMN